MHRTITKYVRGFVAEGVGPLSNIRPETLVVRFTHDQHGETISIAIEDNGREILLAVPFEPVAKMMGDARRRS